MTIQEFLLSYFENKIKEKSCLVFYDPTKKYKEIIESIKNYKVLYVEESTILGREKAMDLWCSLGKRSVEKNKFVIYIPLKKPVKEDEVIDNPYSAIEMGGITFPAGDDDNLQSLCRRAFPDKSESIDELFAQNSSPDFDMINLAVESDIGWPILRRLLAVDSNREILITFLSPSDEQKNELKSNETWIGEYKKFVDHTIGLSVKSKSKNWEFLVDELWRYVLFSEFVQDLPEKLPDTLKNIPHTDEVGSQLINSTCDGLRDNKNHIETYITKAIAVARDLDLEKHTSHIKDFGERDTFSFEEKSFLSVFAETIINGELKEAEKILRSRMKSIWVKNDSERNIIWTIAERGINFMHELDEAKNLLKEFSKDLITLYSGYCERLYLIDKLYRNFEQVVSETFGNFELFESFVMSIRKSYSDFTKKMQNSLLFEIQKHGWPIENQLRSTQVFDKFISDDLKKRKKIGFLMVDALRYELGVELEQLLKNDYDVLLKPACAQLPTTTAVGMASLLPGIDGKLNLQIQKDRLVPIIGNTVIETAEDRFNYLKNLFGDRVFSIWIDDFIHGKKNIIPDNTNLLIIKTRDIDDLGENIPTDVVSLIPTMIKKISSAINKLLQNGYDRVVVATDHGFIFKAQYMAGDCVEKPQGEWVFQKKRCLIGKGNGKGSAISFQTNHVGINCEFPDFVVPLSTSAFKKGALYYHEGISFQECVLPVLSIKSNKRKEDVVDYSINLSYKEGRTDFITTLRPMIEITLNSKQLIFDTQISLEAYAKDKIVGETAQCSYLNPTTNLIAIQQNTPIKIPLKMLEDFRGKFEIRATDPVNQITHCILKLKTNYME